MMTGVGYLPGALVTAEGRTGSFKVVRNRLTAGGSILHDILPVNGGCVIAVFGEQLSPVTAAAFVPRVIDGGRA